MSGQRPAYDFDKWLHTEKPRLPYFVYGTLRPQFGNAWLWERCGATVKFDGQCRVLNYALIDTGSIIPYATYRPRREVWGALILPSYNPEEQVELRESLDALEGYPDHYDRVEVDVDCPGGLYGRAWIYTPTSWIVKGEEVPTGDYVDMRLKYRNAPNMKAIANQ